jgi:hypothetical protein
MVQVRVTLLEKAKELETFLAMEKDLSTLGESVTLKTISLNHAQISNSKDRSRSTNLTIRQSKNQTVHLY